MSPVDVVAAVLTVALILGFPVVMAAVDVRWLTGRWPWQR